MEGELKNSGFVEPVITPEQFVLGGGNVPLAPLKLDSDWSDVRHRKELQDKPEFDTFNCVGFNTLNQIEQYELAAFGELNNYSDRWLGIVAGTKPPGNDPQTVYEAIRKFGLIPDERLPFSDEIKTVEEYYSFGNMTKDQIEACYAEGRIWLSKKNFKHEWVFDRDQPVEEKVNNMKIALKYSPLAIAVYAWSLNEKGIYVRLGKDTHWTSLPSYKEFMDVFDSYEPIEKTVDQEIFYCKRIHMERKTEPIAIAKKKSLWQRFLNWFFREKIIYNNLKNA